MASRPSLFLYIDAASASSGYDQDAQTKFHCVLAIPRRNQLNEFSVPQRFELMFYASAVVGETATVMRRRLGESGRRCLKSLAGNVSTGPDRVKLE